MAEIRIWHSADLPHLRFLAAANAWKTLPPDDQALASVTDVAGSAESNLEAVLSSPGGTALVAEDGGRLVGYLLIGIRPGDRTGEPTGYLADIYIDPAYRGQGIAGRFHEVAESYLARVGIRKATVWTHSHNGLGQKSAQRQGYRSYGAMMSKVLGEQ